MTSPDTEQIKQTTFKGHRAYVDLQKFDANAKAMATLAEPTGRPIRIATKSLRVPALIRRALNSHRAFKGLMCYCAEEALFLASEGFDDFLIAYPTLSPADLVAIGQLLKMKKKVSLVADCDQHLQVLQHFLEQEELILDIIVEIDLSLRIGPLVVGVRRSPLRDINVILAFIEKIDACSQLRFGGLMAYEAQVAGVGDRNPFKPMLSWLLGPLRRHCASLVSDKRRTLHTALRQKGYKEFIFNGGGTGSLSFNVHEKDILTEYTAGSGFYCPHLFDYYSNLSLQPAAFFDLQIVRQPEANWYTCLGGGYVASGEPGWDRIAKIFNSGLNKEKKQLTQKLSAFEATGEVQTPVYSKTPLTLGASVTFRHAKAGELMERFNEVALMQSGQLVETAKTYRGYGQCFI